MFDVGLGRCCVGVNLWVGGHLYREVITCVIPQERNEFGSVVDRATPTHAGRYISTQGNDPMHAGLAIAIYQRAYGVRIVRSDGQVWRDGAPLALYLQNKVQGPVAGGAAGAIGYRAELGLSGGEARAYGGKPGHAFVGLGREELEGDPFESRHDPVPPQSAARRASARSVRSHVNCGSSRPKWP